MLQGCSAIVAITAIIEELATVPDELDEAGWQDAVPLGDVVKRLVSRWQDGYNWREHEALLNAELPHFGRNIIMDGFETTMYNSELETAIPLLFCHGWLGSFIEARRITPLPTPVHPDRPSLHFVTVSCQDTDFVRPSKRRAFSSLNMPRSVTNLCLRLDTTSTVNDFAGTYLHVINVVTVTQGGDWGHMMTRKLVILYGPKHSKALHTNFPTPVSHHFFLLSIQHPGVQSIAPVSPRQRSVIIILLRTYIWLRRIGNFVFESEHTTVGRGGRRMGSCRRGWGIRAVSERVGHGDACALTRVEVSSVTKGLGGKEAP
ncbi:hypothetical protein B0H19DRAFT_1241835 [Mycena capillaripes]|nr:hypothetical protein B0H19DRAFT_1241835 [Mycena capillaripes]